MNFDLILHRNLSYNFQDLSTDEKLKEIEKLEHVHLDRENISKIENLEFLSPSITHIFLQNNKIEKIENLESLINLRCLVLSENLIKKIENVKLLKKLQILDVSYNEIINVSTDEIPFSLLSINIKGNPCALSNTVGQLSKSFPFLIVLDREELETAKISDVRKIEQDLTNSDAGEISKDVTGMLNRSQQRVEENYRQRLLYNNDITDLKEKLAAFMK